jgi:hypothetical protein
MKKLFAIALIATASLVACNNDGEKKEVKTDTAATTAPVTPDTAKVATPDTAAVTAPAKMDTTAK